jgi:hypothetical protein
LMEAQTLPEPTPNDPEERGQDQPYGPRATQPDARGSGHARPVRTLRMSRGRRVGDEIISVLIRAGVVPSSYLLTTRGRRTGLQRSNPVTIVEGEGKPADSTSTERPSPPPTSRTWHADSAPDR